MCGYIYICICPCPASEIDKGVAWERKGSLYRERAAQLPCRKERRTKGALQSARRPLHLLPSFLRMIH